MKHTWAILLLAFPGLCPGQAGDVPRSPAAPVPDLLQDAAQRPVIELSEFQQYALAANPTLREAGALAAQSAAEARQAALYPNPAVGYQGEQIRGGSFNSGEQGAFIQQTLVLGGKLGLRRNVYEQQRRADELGITEQRSRVLSDVSQSFYIALAAQETVTLRRRLLELALDALTTAHQLANVGQADAPDVLQSEVEAEQAKLEYTTAQRVYLQMFRSLAAVAGKPELPVSRLAGDLEHPPQIDGNALLEQIVRDSPSVKRAQQNVLRAQAGLKSARREAIPDVQIRAGLQQNSELLNGAPGARVGVQGFATATVALPIFNRNQGNVTAAEADLARTEAEVSRVQLSLRQSAQPFLQAYLASQAQAERYRTAMIPQANCAYQLYLEKYRNMGAAYPQVLVSQRTLFQLQVTYLAALENIWVNAISLQNFLLSSALSAPSGSAGFSATVNLPSANASTGQ
jgi:cobalt-zinc-cadmium efflux system outer membrane protein